MRLSFRIINSDWPGRALLAARLWDNGLRGSAEASPLLKKLMAISQSLPYLAQKDSAFSLASSAEVVAKAEPDASLFGPNAMAPQYTMRRVHGRVVSRSPAGLQRGAASRPFFPWRLLAKAHAILCSRQCCRGHKGQGNEQAPQPTTAHRQPSQGVLRPEMMACYHRARSSSRPSARWSAKATT